MSELNDEGVYVYNDYGRNWKVGDCVYPYGKTSQLGKIVDIRLKRSPNLDRWAPKQRTAAFMEEVKIVWLWETTRNKYGDDWMPTAMFRSMSQLIADHERKARNFRSQCEELDAM